MHSTGFQIFVQAFKIVIHLKIQYVIAIHLMRWLTNFYDFGFNWTATARIGIHTEKSWLSQLVNFRNAIWTWGHFRRTTCNKIMFKTWKNVTETYGMLQATFWLSCMNRASVFEWHKKFKRRCPWCNGYRRRNWTRRHEFKSWTDCISHSTNTLGKGMNPIILPPAMGK